MTLYDAYGREVDTGMLREEQAAPTMAGVRNIYSVMHPSIGLTPERLSHILRAGGNRGSVSVSRTGRGNRRKGSALPGRARHPQECGRATGCDCARDFEFGGGSARGGDGAGDDLRRADTARQRAVRHSRRGGQGIFGDRDNVGYVWERMVSRTVEVARPALVCVRLDIGRGNPGADAQGR